MSINRQETVQDGYYHLLYPAILCLYWGCFIAFFIGNRGLWNPDEPRYLQVAWEMAKTKHFLIPIFNGQIYSEKPPLYFWLAILMAKIVGFEVSTRWVSALSGLGTLLLTYGIGRRLMDGKTGFLSAIILMTSGFYTLLLTTGNIDMLLTFFTTLAVYAYIRYQKRERTPWLVAAYTACGFAVLAKGPVGFLLPWLLFIVWTVYERATGEKPAWKHLLWGLPVALIPIAAWLVPAIISGGQEYARTILIKQNVGRAVESFAHAKPWYNYFIDFPLIVLPWTVVFIGIIPETLRSVWKKNRPVTFVLLWLILIFTFFSLISGKRSRYLVPLMPAFALVVGYGLSKLEERSVGTLLLDSVGLLISILLAAALVSPILVPFFVSHYKVLQPFALGHAGGRAWALYAQGVLTALALWLGFTLARRKRLILEMYAFTVAFLLLFTGIQIYYLPALDKIKSVRVAVEKVNALTPANGTVAFFQAHYNEGWNFYLNRLVIPVVNAEKLHKDKFDVVIVKKRYLKDLEKLSSYTAAAHIQVGGDIFYLFIPGSENQPERSGLSQTGESGQPAKRGDGKQQ